MKITELLRQLNQIPYLGKFENEPEVIVCQRDELGHLTDLYPTDVTFDENYIYIDVE